MGYTNLAPLRGRDVHDAPWRGACSKKPWEYRVTAVVPFIDTVESLEICVKILRLQTERPYIILVDTGSMDENSERIRSMQSEDLEVHTLRINGMRHPSDSVCAAMDLAQSLCSTEYMFATHSDVFLVRRDYIEWLLGMCGEGEGLFPIVGYEMSPRQHDDWKGMISHTATMYHVRTLDRIGFGWSMRRLASIYGLTSHEPDPERPNWPDTEILGNLILRQHDIPTKIVGGEQNFQRNRDHNIDHCRSMSLGMLYSPSYNSTASKWCEEAKKEAIKRINDWNGIPNKGQN
jgi:hypothetical protein